MLDIIRKVLKIHAATVNEANELFRSVRKKIDSQYINTRKEEEIQKAKVILDETIKESKEKTLQSISETLNDIREKANKVVNAPILPEFSNTLETLRTLKNPGQAEIESLIGRFKNNYFCYRSICDVLGGEVAGYKVVTIDDILESVNELEKSLISIINGNVNGYNYKNHTDGTILDTYNNIFNSFIEGRFEEVAANLYDEDVPEGGNVIETTQL